MAILLQMNTNVDDDFSVYRDYIKAGDIVECIHVDRFTNSDMPATLTINLPKENRGSYLNPFSANINCFDYVGNSNEGK